MYATEQQDLIIVATDLFPITFNRTIPLELHRNRIFHVILCYIMLRTVLKEADTALFPSHNLPPKVSEFRQKRDTKAF